MGASDRSQSPSRAGTALWYQCWAIYAKIPISWGSVLLQPRMQTILYGRFWEGLGSNIYPGKKLPWPLVLLVPLPCRRVWTAQQLSSRVSLNLRASWKPSLTASGQERTAPALAVQLPGAVTDATCHACFLAPRVLPSAKPL